MYPRARNVAQADRFQEGRAKAYGKPVGTAARLKRNKLILIARVDEEHIERLLGHMSTEYLDGAYFKPPDSEMIAAYRRAIPNLTILDDVQSEEFQKKQLLRQAALLLSGDKMRMLQEILARSRNIDMAVEEFRKLREAPTHDNAHEIVSGEDAMIEKLNQGWELTKELNSDKFLMKK